MNRNGCFELHLKQRGFRKAEEGENPQVGHWDVYKVDPIDAEFDNWPRSCTNVLDNIWTYYQRVFDLGLESDFPETIFDWRKMTQEKIESSPVWFLKNIWGVHGKGITLVTGWEDYKEKCAGTEHQKTQIIGPNGRPEPVPDMYFMQRGICNPHLIDGKKYILRTFYMTLGDGRVYLYNDCLGYVHAVPFDASKGDWNVHVSHFKMWNGEKDTRTYFTLSDIPEYETIFGYMVEHSKRHSLIWAEVAWNSLDNPDPKLQMDATRYQIWGTDYLVMDDLTSYLIEVNAFPNLNHHVTPPGSLPRPHEHEFRLKGFDRDILRILGVDDGGVPADTPLTWVDVTHPTVGTAGPEPEPER
jgi:hypothetical protein